jgi:hypothetical protein
MGSNERRIIDGLFDRLRKAEEQSGPRDPEAEALIARHVAAQPAAPYYMAQAIVVQQDALGRARARIEDRERRLAERRSGGFPGGLFGGEEEPAAPARGDRDAGGIDRDRGAGAGGGFLAGAMQTALGVAGGVLIADMISGLLAVDHAAAAAPAHEPALTEEDRFGGEGLEPSEEAADGDFDFDEF